MRQRLGARLAAAVLVTAAAVAGVAGSTASPASAAACESATGVTVVVDRGALGGGIAQVCNPASGGKAAGLFTSSGFSLTYVQREPGFVCRIDGQPASDPCVNTPPADAYWGLWWSDGSSGSWSYSSVGAGSLTVPDGGYVAFAWQSGSRSAPGVPATPHAASPSPTPTATPGSGSSGGGGGHNGGGGSAGPTTKPSAHPSRHPTTPSAKPSAAPTAAGAVTPSAQPTTAPAVPDQTTSAPATAQGGSATESPSTSSEPAATSAPAPASPSDAASSTPVEGTSEATAADDGALPVWVVPLVIVALGAAGGASYLLRRRRQPGP
jgi:hypothetical protein